MVGFGGGGSAPGTFAYAGALNCSANPNYPAANAGAVYLVSVAGRIGGGSGKLVDAGDEIKAIANNAGGTEASVGTSWIVTQGNLVGAMIGSNNLSELTTLATARTNIGMSANGSSLVSAADFAAMRTLLGQGMNLINVTTLSGDATKTISNVFSSTYKNYCIIANITGSAAADIRMQMDASGTPNTANYYSAGVRYDYANATANLGTTNVAYWTLGQVTTTNQSAFKFDLFRPQEAAITKIAGVPMTESTATLYASLYGGLINDTAQYNSFKLLASTGNMTGTVWTYGYLAA